MQNIDRKKGNRYGIQAEETLLRGKEKRKRAWRMIAMYEMSQRCVILYAKEKL